MKLEEHIKEMPLGHLIGVMIDSKHPKDVKPVYWAPFMVQKDGDFTFIQAGCHEKPLLMAVLMPVFPWIHIERVKAGPAEFLNFDIGGK